MAELRIDYDETKKIGTQVSSKASEFNDILMRIKNLNIELQAYWEGSDAKKYSTALEEQLEVMQKLATTTNEIGQFLVKIGGAYEETMQNNINAIK